MRLVLFFCVGVCWAEVAHHLPWWVAVPLSFSVGVVVAYHWRPFTEWLAGALLCEKRWCMSLDCRLRGMSPELKREIANDVARMVISDMDADGTLH